MLRFTHSFYKHSWWARCWFRGWGHLREWSRQILCLHGAYFLLGEIDHQVPTTPRKHMLAQKGEQRHWNLLICFFLLRCASTHTVSTALLCWGPTRLSRRGLSLERLASVLHVQLPTRNPLLFVLQDFPMYYVQVRLSPWCPNPSQAYHLFPSASKAPY